MSSSNDITEAFARARDGDPDAVERLLPMVYEELHALAEGKRVVRHSARVMVLVR